MQTLFLTFYSHILRTLIITVGASLIGTIILTIMTILIERRPLTKFGVIKAIGDSFHIATLCVLDLIPLIYTVLCDLFFVRYPVIPFSHLLTGGLLSALIVITTLLLLCKKGSIVDKAIKKYETSVGEKIDSQEKLSKESKIRKSLSRFQ